VQKWATFEYILDDQISKHVPLKQTVEGQKRKPHWLYYKALKYAKYKNCKHPAYM